MRAFRRIRGCTWVYTGMHVCACGRVLVRLRVCTWQQLRGRRMFAESQSPTGPLQVFLSQLHQRAMFLNAAFQDRVREVIAGHSDQVRQQHARRPLAL